MGQEFNSPRLHQNEQLVIERWLFIFNANKPTKVETFLTKLLLEFATSVSDGSSADNFIMPAIAAVTFISDVELAQ